jgi:hypothetical protein
MKTAIIGIMNNPATSENSHSAGMVNIVSKLFDAEVITENENWNNYDRLIIYHGPNFKSGSFNIIGGLTDDIIFRAKKLTEYNGKIYSLDGFQLNEFSVKRKLETFDNYLNIELINLPERQNLVIGDSHSISAWPDESYGISRNDGKTLHGFLKMNLDLSNYKHIIMYFGNIDIRFHLSRQANPIEATKDLFNRYCEYASKYNSSIVQLLPIEDESRKIPKSGLYKGKPFFGDIELRKELRRIANDVMLQSGIDFLTWPDYFVDEKSNLKFDIMEPKQSVHIRPKYYMKENKKQFNLFNF